MLRHEAGLKAGDKVKLKLFGIYKNLPIRTGKETLARTFTVDMENGTMVLKNSESAFASVRDLGPSDEVIKC